MGEATAWDVSTAHESAGSSSWILCFPSSTLRKWLGRQIRMFQVLGHLPAMWETSLEFLPPGFRLAESQQAGTGNKAVTLLMDYKFQAL